MQPQVDFYLISQPNNQDKFLFACRLLEKAYARNHRVFVYCASQSDAEHLDELLWTYKEDSFIPHNLQGEGPEPPPAVQIGFGEEPRGYEDVLMNLSAKIPKFYSKFKRVIEIVPANEEAKSMSREHYRDYRNQQCALNIHEIKT